MPSEEGSTGTIPDQESENEVFKELQKKDNENTINNKDPEESSNCTGSSESASGSKRKLPDWMLPQNNEASSSTNKKTKIATTMGMEKTDEINENIATNQNNVDNIPTSSIKIKVEPQDDIPSTSGTNNDTVHDSIGTVSVKKEPESHIDDVKPTYTSTADIKPPIKVEKADATSTTVTRESCKYGIRCYRRNPMHRMQVAHPGDSDYRRPKFPAPAKGTPDCAFGNACYRRNPVHFQEYNHPMDTDFEQNYKNYRMRLRKRCQQQQQQQLNNPYFDDAASGFSSDLDDYDLDDPFIDDGDSEYMPSNDEEDDEDDELGNQNADDYDDDDIDKAEE